MNTHGNNNEITTVTCLKQSSSYGRNFLNRSLTSFYKIFIEEMKKKVLIYFITVFFITKSKAATTNPT